MNLEKILILVEEETKKRKHTWYVDVPYMQGMFLERISILTPKGKEALQLFKNIMDAKEITELKEEK